MTPLSSRIFANSGDIFGRSLAGCVAIVLALLLLAPVTSPVRAQVEIDITRGKVEPLPIAIPAFMGRTEDDRDLAAQISGVIVADLERSGLFEPLDSDAFIERIDDVNATPRFGDWRLINAQALVVGEVSHLGDGRLKTEFRVWDVFAGRQLDGQQFFTRPDNWRRIAHIIADAVYERLTGEKGYFDTRIIFVDERGLRSR